MITLGVIGIVAAMTLPTLVGKYQEKVTIARLKKAYSILSQAYISATNDYGYPDEWEIVQSDDDTPVQTVTYYNVLKKYIKRLRICNATDCRAVYKFLNGSEDGNSSYRAASFPMILPDGTYIKVSPLEDKDTMDCSYNRGSTNALKSVCNSIYVDINGSQKPNTYGRDIFIFYWTKAGLVPMGSAEENSHVTFDTCSTSNSGSYSGYGCAAWVLFNENMDYLHCNNLSWNGKTKC